MQDKISESIPTTPTAPPGSYSHLCGLDFPFIGAVEEVHDRHEKFAGTGDGHGSRRPGHLKDVRADHDADDECQQEDDAPVPVPVPQGEQVGVDDEVHPRGRRHGGADLGHAERPRLDDLAAGRKGHERDDDQRHRACQLDAVDVLEGRCGEDHGCLDEVAGYEP